MDISFDPSKRAETLANRGLDFMDAEKVFGGKVITIRMNAVTMEKIVLSPLAF